MARDKERREFSKLPNAFIGRGILAHLRPAAVKVYLALLSATRSTRNECWPPSKRSHGGAASRRTASPRKRTTSVEHGLLQKEHIGVRNRQRVISPRTTNRHLLSRFPRRVSGLSGGCAPTSPRPPGPGDRPSCWAPDPDLALPMIGPSPPPMIRS
ncbi:MAG: hypothetical protein M0C28_48430 [Candidatus Moduliflexus flocculans]|nr:hypothetical protein [Candidatus Moduliflexus flocculans]